MNYKNGTSTRKTIIEGSKKYFLENGFTAVTYRELGQALNVNPNLISYHFSGKKKLGERILCDFFTAEDAVVEACRKEDYSPVLVYAIRNRIHYKILARNPSILRLYREVISSDFLRDIFFFIPDVRMQYSDFFNYYHLEKEYPDEYYSAMETASENEIIKRYEPEMYENDKFLFFIGSILPVFIGIDRKEIESSFKKAKEICLNADVDAFTF